MPLRKKTFLIYILLLTFLFPTTSLFAQETSTSDESELIADADYYQKYSLYQKYEKYKKYKKYKKAKKKYGFDSSSEKFEAKDAYKKYKLFKKNPVQYAGNVVFYEKYKKYKKYKKYYSPLKKYSKYKKYYKDKYKKYSKYGGDEYKAAYDRYNAKLAELATNFGEADLGCGITDSSTSKCLGPLISVGLWSYSKSGLQDDPFDIEANKPYRIKNSSGDIVGSASIDGEIKTSVTYVSGTGGTMRISNSLGSWDVANEIIFESADGNGTDIVFDAHRPNSSYDEYRYSVKLKYSDTSKQIWTINVLPLEQYVWGMGEITGTGDEKYNRVMTVSFRTYGYWKLKFSTKYATEGFKVNATPGNQLYYGYEWEIAHPRIKAGAEYTQGKLMMYNNGSINEIAITPYSSWTDGRTRSFEERWGSTAYPWCKSVSDPYGKHATMSTEDLENAGNHMVGLSANGALNLATNHSWDYQKIMSYYYSAINFLTSY